MSRRPLLTLHEYRVLTGQIAKIRVYRGRPIKRLDKLERRGFIDQVRKRGGWWAWQVTQAGKTVAEMMRELTERD